MTILIIGLGSIAKKHIYAIRKLYPNCKIYALRSQEKQISKIEGVINVFNIEEIEENVYCVLITNPTSLHNEAIKKSLHLNVFDNHNTNIIDIQKKIN